MITFGNRQVRTHPLNPFLLKREKGRFRASNLLSPFSFQEKGAGGMSSDLNVITEFESQNLFTPSNRRLKICRDQSRFDGTGLPPESRASEQWKQRNPKTDNTASSVRETPIANCASQIPVTILERTAAQHTTNLFRRSKIFSVIIRFVWIAKL